MGIGSKLKEAREEKDISLESLQDTTKIQKRYLIAIEEENYGILPGKFYARAFIKEYATAVGLDPNELLEEFKEDIPSPEENTVQYTRINRSRKDNSPAKNSQIFSLIPTIIVILLVIGIVFAAWWFLQSDTNNDDANNTEEPNDSEEIIRPNDNNDDPDIEDSSEEDNEETEDEETDIDEETDEVQEDPVEPELTVVETGTGNPPESTLELSNPGDELIVTMETTGQSWLDVKNDQDEVFYSDNFNSDASPMELDLSGEERIYFNIGSTPNLQISINGVELEYPIDPSEKDFQRLWINVIQENE
ncbi:protein RodZ, contains Xre-like HTH and DUF4115 domains [Oceanobacillus limi]|uniref:Protein RodZ, contains Xre-like HTH and DUF4115 domains n=1 Tax=Oceanobacillus limi TaxID=930131 RepID=A0A1H9Z6F7_9BACI|nr:helix-turn-helix domain-containing protein [Oceanobacillus limi]SES77019.1 protein RodZ, contains Xre-like HTH and DUF4115 domains [Oceanobacillus limi]